MAEHFCFVGMSVEVRCHPCSYAPFIRTLHMYAKMVCILQEEYDNSRWSITTCVIHTECYYSLSPVTDVASFHFIPSRAGASARPSLPPPHLLRPLLLPATASRCVPEREEAQGVVLPHLHAQAHVVRDHL